MKRTKQRGITLIALVITIIVLLILAGVSIAMLTGENGVLTKATEAKDQNEIATEKEEISMAYAAAKAGKVDRIAEDVTADELNAELGKVNSKGTASGTGTLTVIYENGHKYKINQETGEITGPTEGTPPPETGKTDGSFDEEKGVNTPKLGNNMELVIYDEGTQKWVKDETNSAYSYETQTGSPVNSTTNEWANARVTINGVESYFVWIPRYEYKIDSETKTIDVRFIPTTQTTADEGYTIHPAFTANKENGGWSTELAGLWIGKYESARSDSEGTTQGSSTTIKIQPNVTSWRDTTIGDMYNYAKAYSTELQSHMLKNSEWGAVAYLTHSKYGRNGTEIAINNSSSYITGTSGGSANASSSGTKYVYNDATNGVLASSTGNVYGIYDLSGGAWEYVASYYKDGDFSSANSTFTTGTSDQYSTAYDGTDVNTDYKQGDATYETKGWNGDSASFVSSYSPFFSRGGYYDATSSAGVFSFSCVSGYVGSSNSFRVCLAV